MSTATMPSAPTRARRPRQPPTGLEASQDRKTTPRATLQVSRDRWVPTIKNSFGIPAHATCPGQTGFCNGCYATLAENSSNVAKKLWRNYRLLLEAGTVEAMAAILGALVLRFRRRANFCQLPPADRIFRLHWSGDFFSIIYAMAWAQVIRANPDITFWVYTRTFRPALNVVPYLVEIPNLRLYLSVDEENLDDARRVWLEYPEVHRAWCAETVVDARLLAAGESAVVCPENTGAIPLIQNFKGETIVNNRGPVYNGRGACSICRVCPDGRGDVIFIIQKDKWHRQRDDTSPSPVMSSEATGEKRCANPACGKPLVIQKSRGREKIYCDRRCQVQGYQRRKTQASRQMRQGRREPQVVIQGEPVTLLPTRRKPAFSKPVEASLLSDGDEREVEVAAETLAKIINSGLVSGGPIMRASLLEVLGLDEGELAAAEQRLQLRPLRELPDIRLCANEDCRRPLPPGTNRGKPRKYCSTRCGDAVRRRLKTQQSETSARSKATSGDTRICVRCGAEKNLEDDFLQRKGSRSRHTVCNDCRKKYSRSRYLTTKMTVDGFAVRFVLQADDACVGNTCSRCHQSMLEGDEIESDEITSAHHAQCPP